MSSKTVITNLKTFTPTFQPTKDRKISKLLRSLWGRAARPPQICFEFTQNFETLFNQIASLLVGFRIPNHNAKKKALERCLIFGATASIFAAIE